MKMQPFDLQVIDYHKARETAAATRVGTYFAFTEGLGSSSAGRLARLLAKPAKTRAVHPLVGAAIDLPGLRISPRDRSIDPLACVVSDRDLYRAEQDTASVFVAMPSAPKDAVLTLRLNGAQVAERSLAFGDAGVTIEPFPMLLAGQYTADLAIGGLRLAARTAFTVAQYSLAPLTATLTSHRLDRRDGALHFTLDVESYQVPLDRPLRASLVENDRERSTDRIHPATPGHYTGSLPVAGGEGALRIRVSLDDVGYVAEVAIPGSRQSERDVTVVNELGREILLSLMPESGALPVRGAYLSQGDFLSTPLLVERVDAHPGIIRAQTDVESLVLVVLDLATGRHTVKAIGDVHAGAEIAVDTGAPAASVFAGCWVGGMPFEGMTSFFRPVTTTLAVRVPASVEPATDLPVTLACSSTRDVPVLLCIRDQRLTATVTPESSLASAMKRGIAAAAKGMADAGIGSLTDELPPLFSRRDLPVPPATSSPGIFARGGASHDATVVARPKPAGAAAPTAGAPDAARVRATVSNAPLSSLARTESTTPQEPARAAFPDVIFYGIVPVAGERTLQIPLGDSLGTFSVEAFALDRGDWTETRASFVVDKAVRADLDVPPAVHPEDDVSGRLRASSRHGRVRVTLACEGNPVALTPSGAEHDSPVHFTFMCKPGRYVAEVTDVATGTRDAVEVEVGTPGRFRSMVRELGFLQAGESITLDSAHALSLRVLPGLDEQMTALVEATADYGHLCCEQTAAKILSATVMYLRADGPAKTRKAESIILAGLAREKTMWRPGQGFSMYPENREAHGYYSPLVVRYLWSLSALSGARDLSPALASGLREGLAMTEDVARALRLSRVPEAIASIEDAWAAASDGARSAARAKAFVETAIDFTKPEPAPRTPVDKVRARALLAYGAAVLIAAGDVVRGIRIANIVMRQLNEQGRLYSTVDSIAAIALMTALRNAGVATGAGRVKINGALMDSAAAVALSDQVETIEVISGVIPVEVTRIVEEDWSRFSSQLQVKVGFRDAADSKAFSFFTSPLGSLLRKTAQFAPGDRVDLRVELPQGYRAGDLVHVALPAAMSWISGGGRVKKFSMDFEGHDEISVPLVVTGPIAGKQHFAVCVRNMFEEERAASPGLLTVGG